MSGVTSIQVNVVKLIIINLMVRGAWRQVVKEDYYKKVNRNVRT